MPIWNGSSTSSVREYSGVTERNRLGAPPPQPPPPPPPPLPQTNTTVAAKLNKTPLTTTISSDEILSCAAAVDEVAKSTHGVPSSHDSQSLTLNLKSGQHIGGGDERHKQQQLTTNSKKRPMAEEEAMPQVVVITEEEIPTQSAASSKSYLRRLGDYLNRRRTRTISGEPELEEEGSSATVTVVEGASDVPVLVDDEDSLSNVIIYRDKSAVVDKQKKNNNNKDQTQQLVMSNQIKQKQGLFVISDKLSLSSDSSYIEMEGLAVVEKKATTTGYLLPRVSLNKEG